MTDEHFSHLTDEQFDRINELTELLATTKSLVYTAQEFDLKKYHTLHIYDYINALYHLLDKTENTFQALSETL